MSPDPSILELDRALAAEPVALWHTYLNRVLELGGGLSDLDLDTFPDCFSSYPHLTALVDELFLVAELRKARAAAQWN